jgi:hypothetical protein
MAIKVNGTTVINDSRALSNIASVDATTAASMTAAGVGGEPGWEYVTTVNNTGTVSYIDYDFDTTYNHFMIMTSGWKNALTYTYRQPNIRFKLKTNSSTLYSGYTAYEEGDGSRGYGDPHVDVCSISVSTSTYGNCPTATVHLHDVKDSSTRTRFRVDGGSLYEFSPGYSEWAWIRSRHGDLTTPGTFTGIRFYPTEYTITSGTKFKIWGML